jgi:hypothetical protein
MDQRQLAFAQARYHAFKSVMELFRVFHEHLKEHGEYENATDEQLFAVMDVIREQFRRIMDEYDQARAKDNSAN